MVESDLLAAIASLAAADAPGCARVADGLQLWLDGNDGLGGDDDPQRERATGT
jgi:hypothetical protein